LRYGVRTNMAVIHGAWTFDPVAFHRWLESWTVWEGELQLGALQELAKTVFADTTRITRRALEYMRMDEELLEDPRPDESLADHWYYCALARQLDPAPSLSTILSPVAFYDLEAVLPLLDWSADEVRTLIYGRPMGSLATTYGSEVIAGEFGTSLNMERDRGWVDLTVAEELLSRLAVVEDHFYYPTPEVLENRHQKCWKN
jgi:hypothetical protein